MCLPTPSTARAIRSWYLAARPRQLCSPNRTVGQRLLRPGFGVVMRCLLVLSDRRQSQVEPFVHSAHKDHDELYIMLDRDVRHINTSGSRNNHDHLGRLSRSLEKGPDVRLANVDNRAVVLMSDTSGVDVERASDGKFGPAPADVYADWAAFVNWSATIDPQRADVSIDRKTLGAPSPQPRQIFAIGLNYDDHAAESGFDSPTGLPPVFTKFVSSLSGPDTVVTLPKGGNTDWEVELVAVIGREASRVTVADAWGFVAGLTVGQDISERKSQLQGPAPQFGLGKSFPGFAPTGPWLVTPDELDGPDDLELGCELDGVLMQEGRTKDLIVSIPGLVSALSHTVTLYPGDIIFSGTPSGVGLGRNPQRFIQPGEKLRSWIAGIGELNQLFIETGAKDGR